MQASSAEKLQERHKPIEKYSYSVGEELQYVDSQMAEKVMLQFAVNGLLLFN